MAKKLGSVLERQFKKLGIEITDELKPLIELDTEIGDEVADKVDKGLLTIEAAKTNPDVLKTLRQNILGTADARMADIIKENGITMGEDYEKEQSTYEKLSLLSKAILEHGRKKAEAAGKEGISESIKKERAEWALKEADLQKKLKDITDALTAKEKDFTTTRENDLTTFELQKILLGKDNDYVFPKEMDKNLKVTTALGAVNNELKKKGLVIKRDEAGSLVITDKDGNQAYTESHEKISDVTSYIDGVLTQHKLLKVNDPNQHQQQQQQGQGAGGFVPNNGAGKGNASIVAEIDQQLKQFA